jgi:glc operon protein GlcG
VKTKKYLTLEDAKKIAAAAEAMAHKNSWAVCIAIVDDGGHLLWFQRLDNCAPSSVAIAQAKAGSAAMRRRATKGDEDMVNNGRVSALSMPGVTFLEGGVPIVVDGEVIGAVGVSGVKSSDDAAIAAAGIAAVVDKSIA